MRWVRKEHGGGKAVIDGVDEGAIDAVLPGVTDPHAGVAPAMAIKERAVARHARTIVARRYRSTRLVTHEMRRLSFRGSDDRDPCGVGAVDNVVVDATDEMQRRAAELRTVLDRC